MQKAEKLMSMYPEVFYTFDPSMPGNLKGLNIDDHIYLNPHQKSHELNSTIAEEIGHYLTSVGNITRQETNEERKQERKARDVGATLVVTPDNIIECFEEGCQSIQQCAEFLEVTEETFMDAIKYYGQHNDRITTTKNHTIRFNENGTLQVYKSFVDL